MAVRKVAVRKDIREPPCPRDEDQFRGCLTFVGGVLTYYINRRCKAGLLWDFWFNYAESPFYEDPPLVNDFYEALTNRQDWVEYSETIIIQEKDAPKRDTDYPTGYRHLAHRLDFYMTKPEFRQAFRRIEQLGRKRGQGRVTETIIFGVLHMVLLDDTRFGERPAPTTQVHLHPVDSLRPALDTARLLP